MLNEYERYKIKGYIHILQNSIPNGRHVHLVKQKLTVLRICLEMNLPLKLECENRIKKIIRKMY